jgi:CubicO group peptidase (beta-lactamase class C family)
VPNGGVYSTVADLGRFLGAVAGVPGLRILSEESRLEMISVQTPENPDRGYGLGFSVQRTEGGSQIVSHGGSVAGYTAYMAVDTETGVGVVLLRNYNQGETNLARAAQSLIQELAPVLR